MDNENVQILEAVNDKQTSKYPRSFLRTRRHVGVLGVYANCQIATVFFSSANEPGRGKHLSKPRAVFSAKFWDSSSFPKHFSNWNARACLALARISYHVVKHEFRKWHIKPFSKKHVRRTHVSIRLRGGSLSRSQPSLGALAGTADVAAFCCLHVPLSAEQSLAFLISSSI